MNSVFSRSARSPLRCNQLRTSSKPEHARRAAERKVVEAAKIAPSSTNMLSEREGDQRSVSLRRGEVKIADRMGERGEPCGVP